MESAIEKTIEKATVRGFLTGEMRPVLFDIYSPFVDFLEEYLKMTGSTLTLEDIFRRMIYAEIKILVNDLNDFVSDHYHVTLADFAAKWGYILNADFPSATEEAP